MSAPVNTSPPVIVGKAIIGEVVFVTHGSWTNEPSAFTYQWFRGAEPIGGETQRTYVPTSADVGELLSVEETASNPAGSGSAVSTSTSAVVANTRASREILPPATEEATLKWPFRMSEDETHIPFIEQDTAEEYEQCVALVLTTVPGEFPDEVDFGFPDPTFAEGGVSEQDIAATVRKWEPRAHLYFTLDEIIQFAQELSIQVKS